MPEQAELADEQLGTKEKFWVSLGSDDAQWLFKYARTSGAAVRGEDWAEWLVHAIGGELGVPTAKISPAVCGGRRGILSRSVVDQAADERLVHGNSLLSGVDPAYDIAEKRENSRYTVSTVRDALRQVAAPREFGGPSAMSGFDVWAGYLVLDALVAGRDRHHENWAVIRRGADLRLAPSFDHGNALGFQETDAKLTRLNGDSSAADAWLRHGTSHYFAGKPLLTDLAFEALNLSSSVARRHWLGVLEAFTPGTLVPTLNMVPPEIMSDQARTFVLTILMRNLERLRDGYPGE